MVQFLGELLFEKFRNAARTQYLDIIVYIQTKLHHMNKFLTGERCCLRRDEDFYVTCLNQILDFGRVHLDLRSSKKLMPNEHHSAFQNFYFYNKVPYFREIRWSNF